MESTEDEEVELIEDEKLEPVQLLVEEMVDEDEDEDEVEDEDEDEDEDEGEDDEYEDKDVDEKLAFVGSEKWTLASVVKS